MGTAFCLSPIFFDTYFSAHKPMGQLVTGSCVNAVLAISALVGGLGCGATVAAISPVLAYLLAAGTLKTPMLKALPATFSCPQLFTALIGGAAALLIVPVIRKALHKKGLRFAKSDMDTWLDPHPEM